MRSGFVLCSVLLFLAGGICAQANVLENPGFEEGDTGQITNVPIPGWLTWNYSGWHHDDVGAVIDTKAVKLWWTDSGIYQDFPTIAGHTYRFSGYMLHTSGDPLRDGSDGTPGDKTGEFRVEWYDAGNLIIGTDIMFGQITKDDPTDTWLFYTDDLKAPAGAAFGRYLIRMYQSTAGDGAVNYDNTSVYDLALYGQAYDPDPADGATVTLDLDDLSWKSHDPNDVFTFDVYLEAEGPIVDPNFTSAPIAVGISDNTVNLTSAGVTLVDNTIYTWRVDTTDPNNGWPVMFPGNVWTFQVGDVAPLPYAENQYVWLVNGEGHFTLSGSYTDDGKSTVIRAEFVEGTHEKAGGTVVTMGTPTWDSVAQTVTVDVTVSNPVPDQEATGWYEFILEVEDAAGVGTDTVNVGVYGTCLEAALADPADTIIETNWPNGQHGDIDGDCDTDLGDFALMAASWASCMTEKAGCTP